MDMNNRIVEVNIRNVKSEENTSCFISRNLHFAIDVFSVTIILMLVTLMLFISNTESSKTLWTPNNCRKHSWFMSITISQHPDNPPQRSLRAYPSIRPFLFLVTGHMRHVYRFPLAKWWSKCLRAWFIDWHVHRSALHICAAHSIAYTPASSVQCIALYVYVYEPYVHIYVYILWFIQFSFPYSFEMHYWHSDNRIAQEFFLGNEWGYDE